MPNIKNLWPCIDTPGLQIFATTADQRYELGEDVFLKTHFPIRLRRFSPEMPPEDLDEAYLLKQLGQTSGLQPGNRVFVLYGAAGSGKSELMRWLQIRLAGIAPDRSKVTVRIPRTELNVLKIAEKFQHMLSGRYFSEVTHQRWKQAANKPRTLAKLLLLTALERSLDSDEQINALYYRLLAWIEPRIVRSLNAVTETKQQTSAQLEILTREDFAELRAETTLSVPLDYEQFRYHLTQAFREQLMEGLYLPDILQQVSTNLSSQGERPILLIDDLVQSINLFATELLDYFITLNSGNWDVVIGLTPAALAVNQRGQELLERISYLDTVDDRVEKLWLSDIQGTDSYFLTEKSCLAFTVQYLQAYRAYNGWQCATCQHRDRCRQLGTVGGDLLAPFNQVVLKRLFQSLPSGKGKARQYLHRLRAVLEGAADSQGLLPMLQKYVRPRFAVETNDPVHKVLAESYGVLTKDRRMITLSAELLNAFDLADKNIKLPAESLQTRPRRLQNINAQPESQEDPGRLAIRAWLEGDEVNRQSLLPLRQGVARWMREVLNVRALHARGIARPHRALKWQRVYLGVRPPIVLQGIDDEDGILVPRDIGLVAFRLYDFAKASGTEKKRLCISLANEERLLLLLHAAADYRHKVRQNLEKQLAITLEELSLGLYTWLVIIEGEPDVPPPGFSEDFWTQISRIRTEFPVWQHKPDDAICKSIRYLFDDFFRLRKNVYDGPSITKVLRGRKPEELLDALMTIAPEAVDEDYRLRKKPLCDVLMMVQDIVRRWREPVGEETDLSAAAQTLLKTLESGNGGILLHQVPIEVFSELQTAKPNLYESLRVIAVHPSDD